ncbi:cbb3-type cytochrome oxidase assembly protein CcoS [Parendozoicomonas haliclonae]|uniref:Cytochrome oxidase maturation protein cbb3-type n=1 Tax=Parendozoicomonas haliclonae TaxID=1960125 RepID=A0A1X7AHZ9_9GAMM|nr:cbb3-type cytochrome oxidase assembly protein CcoS [Parendozoicomonas haliclonae]SMA43573.1 Cytochrome oxidase maturation protein cbb3-type [Parendozoicomonas haliclonae]
MDSLYLLIPIAIVFVAIAVAIFFWAVDNNQFDDLEGPAHSILFDEPEPKSSTAQSSPAKNNSSPSDNDVVQ